MDRTRSMSSENNNNNSNEVAAAATSATAAAATDDSAPPVTTIFDKIVAGTIPCTKVYEDDIALCFRDVNPQAPTHILVIPKQCGGLAQLSKAVGSHKDVLGHLLFVAGQVGKQECPNGFRLVINDGVDGAQSVYHLHIHVLGGRQMQWPPG